MNHFLRSFWPYQIWRFIRMNAKIYAIAKHQPD
uniref:Uncharacterized protein n=1 Tax=mine drainage metagenome TaxID=410659 RepID=E6Q1Z5_9ZZZZ